MAVDNPALDAATGLQMRPSGPGGLARMGIAPTNIEEGWRLAQIFAKSEMVPKGFRGKPEDVIVAIQMGVELGLAPMQALGSIAVINGRAGVWGDGLLALIMAAKSVYADHDEYFEAPVNALLMERREQLTAADLKDDRTCAVCVFVRHGKATPIIRRFSVGQAKKAGLLSKPGPWAEYPDRMLAMRARSYAARDGFPDILRGIHGAEELRDSPPPDDERGPVVREVRRVSETPAPTPLTPTPPAVPAGTTPVATTTLGPIAVSHVEQFLGGLTVLLADGVAVDVADAADAMELAKFAGTSHLVRLVCTQQAGRWSLVSFGIAD